MKRAERLRLRVIACIIVAVALLLVLRLYFVQIIHGHEYALRADNQYLDSSQQLYDRGTIYFTRADGTLLSAATLATGYIVSMNPSLVGDPETTYEKLNALTPIDHDTFIASAAKNDDPYEVIADRVPESVGEAIGALSLPGITVTLERWRTYPAGSAAAQTVGFVGYDNDNSLAGRYGLEREYDSVLDRSGNGLFGNFFAELFANLDDVVVNAQAAREGDVITTIDPIVEQKLDQELAAVNAEYSSQETGGIIMDPHTGAIIALDTYPTFDPNNFAHGDPNTFGNPLVQSQFEWGSIMKTLTMASGLDAGAITPETTYDDTGCIHVNGSTICNYDLQPRGPNTSMQTILSESLNVGASFIATQLGHEKFRYYFEKLGFGVSTGSGLPGEAIGNINNIATSPRDVEYDTAAFGQGIALTPFQMIKGLGALANNGYTVTPHVVSGIRLENGIVKPVTYPAPVQVFGEAAVNEVMKMLIIVVDTKLENGTVAIPTMTVAAKTGTAQVVAPDGTYYQNVFFHSFVGYFPATDPKYIILLYTNRPQGVEYASETLTYPFFDLLHFLVNYYDIPPDRGTDTTS